MSNRPEWPHVLLAALLVIALAVLTALHDTVPSVLEGALLFVLGVGGGVSLPYVSRGVVPSEAPAAAPVSSATQVTATTPQPAPPAAPPEPVAP